MRQWNCAGALALCAAGAYAEDKRDCTDEEERAADRQLTAIAEDATWSKRLVKHHLPFDAHIGGHAAQSGPTNEKLLGQAGYQNAERGTRPHAKSHRRRTTTGAKPPGHHLPDSQGLMTCL